MVPVHELELGRYLEVSARHGAGTVDVDGGGRVGTGPHTLEDESLDVENDVCDVLVDALDCVELLLHAVYLDSLDRRTLQGGEQYATQGVAKRVAVAALERLSRDAGDVVADLLDGNLRSNEF